jgi:hypothetical protein
MDCAQSIRAIINWWCFFNISLKIEEMLHVVTYSGELEMIEAAKGVVDEKEVAKMEKGYKMNILLSRLFPETYVSKENQHPLSDMLMFIEQREEYFEKILYPHIEHCERCRNLASFFEFDCYPEENYESAQERMWGLPILRKDILSCKEAVKLLPRYIPRLLDNPKANLNPSLRQIFHHCNWTDCYNCRLKSARIVMAHHQKFHD